MRRVCCAYSRIPLLDQCGRQAFYTLNRENVSDCEHAAVNSDYTHTHTHLRGEGTLLKWFAVDPDHFTSPLLFMTFMQPQAPLL